MAITYEHEIGDIVMDNDSGIQDIYLTEQSSIKVLRTAFKIRVTFY